MSASSHCCASRTLAKGRNSRNSRNPRIRGMPRLAPSLNSSNSWILEFHSCNFCQLVTTLTPLQFPDSPAFATLAFKRQCSCQERPVLNLSLLIPASAFLVAWTLLGGWPAVRTNVPADPLTQFFEWFGEFGLFCWRMAKAALTPPYEGRELIRQMDNIGSKSLPLVALAGAAVGVVMSMQTRDSFERIGAKSLLSTVIVFSIIK